MRSSRSSSRWYLHSVRAWGRVAGVGRDALDRGPRRRRGAREVTSRVDAIEARARAAPRDPRNTQAAIVENKREDLARDAARLERLEKKMEGAVRGVRRCRHVASTPSTRRVRHRSRPAQITSSLGIRTTRT